MEQKKTTESTSSFLKEADEARGVPRHEPLESEMPRLDENDVWFYQMEIERIIRNNLPETMNGRVLYMVRVLGAQARRAIPEDEQE